MNFSGADIHGTQIQTEPLDSVENLRFDCDEVDLVIETDPALSGTIQLVTSGGERIPELRREGFDLVVHQRGRYRQGAMTRFAPIVRLPVSGCPPISGRIAKGDLIARGVDVPISLRRDSGDVTIDGGTGPLTIDSGKGDFTARQRHGPISYRCGSGEARLERCVGPITVNLGKGDVQARECERGLAVRSGSGDVHAIDCGGEIVIKSGSGDVVVTRPRDARLSASTGSGDVTVEGGSLRGLVVRTARGDINSSARLVLPRGDDEEPRTDGVDTDTVEHEFESIEALIERTVRDAIDRSGAFAPGGMRDSIRRAVEDAMSSSGTRITFGDFEFEAGDDGVRLVRGGVPVFEAGDQGVRISKGSFAFEASDQGVRIKRGATAGEMGVRPGEFEVETANGDVSLHVPADVPLHIEALVSGGDVRSDIPLVSVGRPGPRGSTQRLVGGTSPGNGPRLKLRVRADRGDIRIRAMRYAPSPPVAPAAPAAPRAPASPDAPTAPLPPRPPAQPRTEREERMAAILESLASGSISVAEAERLIEALDSKPES